jgi:hypothetical protein
MQETTHSLGKAIRDSLLLAVLLAGINYVLAANDPGWLDLNPTPWLLLPLLIGARYGVTTGTLSGLACAAGLVWLRSRLDGSDPLAVATQERYPATALAISGFLAGELNHLLRGDSAQMQKELASREDESQRLNAEVSVLRETRHELQKSLALHNAPVACLDAELKKIISVPPDETFQSILSLIHRLAGVTSAGIYRLEGDRLQRDAVIHPTSQLASSIPLKPDSLAGRAMDGKLITAVTDPLESTEQQPFLVAIPWTFRRHSGVLLIQDMPLESLDSHNLSRIEVILHWALTLRTHVENIGSGKSAGKLMPIEEFMSLLAQALETEKAHALPSTVIRLDVKTDDPSISTDGRQILSKLPANALSSKLPNGSYLFLLPFTGAEDAGHVSTKLSHDFPSLRASSYVVASPITTEALWSSLLQS